MLICSMLFHRLAGFSFFSVMLWLDRKLVNYFQDEANSFFSALIQSLTGVTALTRKEVFFKWMIIRKIFSTFCFFMYWDSEYIRVRIIIEKVTWNTGFSHSCAFVMANQSGFLLLELFTPHAYVFLDSWFRVAILELLCLHLDMQLTLH